MLIELESVFNNDGAKKEFSFSFLLDDDAVDGPVRVGGVVLNRTGIVTLDASARFTMNVSCARCLKEFSPEMDIKIEHTLIKQTDTGDEDNDEFIVLESMRLDLEALATEDIYLALPYRFVCSESCRGLCPRCGKDLNEGDCGCGPDIDPRMAALKDLF